jgi:hypothetical protein
MMRIPFHDMPWETSPAGDEKKHRPRALTERVRLILVEEAT